MEQKHKFIIEIDPEFNEVLDRLEDKIKKVTWDGLEKVSKKDLTRIIARKITQAKIV